MPEFEKDTYDLQEWHDQQLRHYGFNTGSPKVTASSRPDTPIPTETASTRNETTGMPVPVPVPKRKPVPKYKPVRPARPADLPTLPPIVPLPALPTEHEDMRKIYRGQDGRFDPKTVKTVTEQTLPVAAERHNGPKGLGIFIPTPVSSGPSSPISTTSTKQQVKRSGTASSTKSSNSWRERRESVTQAVRRASASFSKGVEILKMDKTARQEFVKRRYTNADEVEAPTKPKPSNITNVTAGEQFFLGVSKAMDPLKVRGRTASNASSMSFGLTDRAPTGLLQNCARCEKPTYDYLKDGLCAECVKEVKAGQPEITVFIDPFQQAQSRTAWPDSCSPEDGYMKLPNKKLLRVRNTVYDDPRNPFAEDTDSEGVLPCSNQSPPQREAPSTSTREDAALQAKRDFGDLNFEGEYTRREPGTPKNSVAFAENKQAPSSRRPSSPFDIRAHHRSKSLAEPALKHWDEQAEEYIPPRAFWRHESVPADQALRKEESMKDECRDTKFYGFYDLIDDYTAKER